ncbi:unnamed protein product [Adineta ricciae]|uniref:F-box domain-containing protein n=1 Tax=Adineta ricciae TaxID=249248 RepID=A0A815HF11_ADIRI|nr:unnamed protein product [Adineta ricciae]CAF1349931.1 unnamed protein product [Adineta ricciae]
MSSISQSSNHIKNTVVMKLESLPVELLLGFFDYFSTNDLFQKFLHLNAYFDSLVFDYVRLKGLNFRSISQIDFDTICLKYLPNMANQIASLALSNSQSTPTQITRFFKYGFNLSQFTCLTSLSLCAISSGPAVDQILSELSHLDHFTRLVFKQCSFPMRGAPGRINAIWSLPKLSHCCLEIYADLFRAPTVISSSIRSFSLYVSLADKEELARLFAHTPYLRYFSTNLLFGWYSFVTLPPNILIKTLSLSLFNVQATVLVSCLQQFVNLRRLKLGMIYCFIYGDQWEQMIKTHLPNLTVFQFRMKSAFDKENNCEERIDEIFQTFRSPFWLDERHWYVRCDWSPDYGKMSLYTVPYAFEDFTFEYSVISKSTYPCKSSQRLYDSVHQLTYKARLLPWSTRSRIQFFNIRTLIVEFPISDFFYSMVPNFEQLTALEVSSNDRSTHPTLQLQILLDRSPNLQSLHFRIWPSSNVMQNPPFDSRSTSIRQLDLRYMNRCYDNEQCIALAQSPLGRQCEILTLTVKNKSCIFDLVNNMHNLRTLAVTYDESNITHHVWSSTKDQLIEELGLGARFNESFQRGDE